MSSSGSSEASPSPSPSSSVAAVTAGTGAVSDERLHTLPTLERLVAHYVAAKRALGAIQHVQQATQLVTDSKSVIENIAVTGAKNGYIHTRIERQVDVLHAISDKVSLDAAEVDEEFQTILARLDEANDRLQATIQSLRDVVVDASLARTAGRSTADLVAHNSDEEDETATSDNEHKTLFDYVDETQYNQLSAALKTYIDSFRGSRSHLEQYLDNLHSSSTAILSLLNNNNNNGRPDSPTVKATLYDEPPVPVTEAFSQMEEHATEMANLLQSLISHYDHCVSALKHTEGGREAARQAMLKDASVPSTDEALEESLYTTKVADSMSREERSEILRIIEGDAVEVDEVVEDLRARGAEIEQSHHQLRSQADVKRSEHRRLVRAVELVRQTHDALPTSIQAAEDFRATWVEIQASIDARAQDIANLCAFYAEFISGYERLLLEVERRAEAEAQMHKVADKAQKELDRLHENDRLLREEFVEDVGSFLPSDLWPGAIEAGARWHIHAEVPLPPDGPDNDPSQSHGIEIA